MHKDLGKLDEAVASYRKALGIKPEYTEAHNNLGIALLNVWSPRVVADGASLSAGQVRLKMR